MPRHLRHDIHYGRLLCVMINSVVATAATDIFPNTCIHVRMDKSKPLMTYFQVLRHNLYHDRIISNPFQLLNHSENKQRFRVHRQHVGLSQICPNDSLVCTVAGSEIGIDSGNEKGWEAGKVQKVNEEYKTKFFRYSNPKIGQGFRSGFDNASSLR